ncbi:MAG: hypothetical protein QNJ77_13055 [Acidimicrobiia bacterium]|nr:hypothetical protein [Acidimicrobiia bacterium]
MNANVAFDLLRSIGLPHGDYAVFGSGPLLIRGIIDDAPDLDVIARGAAWSCAAKQGQLVDLPEHGVSVASFYEGAVTVGNRWAIGDVSIDELIDSAEIINGLPFVSLEHVRAYKVIANRKKDRDHLESLDRWLAEQHGDDGN